MAAEEAVSAGWRAGQEGVQAGLGAQPVHHSPPEGPGCPAPLSLGVCLPHFLLSSGALRAY